MDLLYNYVDFILKSFLKNIFKSLFLALKNISVSIQKVIERILSDKFIHAYIINKC